MKFQLVKRASGAVAGVLVTGSLLLAPAAAAVTVEPSQTPQASWTGTGSLSVPRERAAGVLLNNGRALMMGGQFCGGSPCVYYSTGESYDPATGTWSPAGVMSTPRTDFQAVLLSNGKALAIGGANGAGNLTADLYDPATNSFSFGGSFAGSKSSGFKTVVMADGRVLAVGGCCVSPGPYSAAADIYNPATNTWSSAPNMSTSRLGPIAILLPTGKVLVAGGLSSAGTYLSSSELYDPATNTWSPGGNLVSPRWDASTVLMPGGKVLVTGGNNSGGCLATSEVYNPTTNTFGTQKTGPKPKSDETAVPIMVNDGKILVAGQNCSLKTAALYDPTANSWASTTAPLAQRRDQVMTRLRSGLVLAAGGDNFSSSLSSAELYHPNTAATAYATPNPVKKGAVLTIAGSGFQAGETVKLSYNGFVYTSTVADGTGKFTVNFSTATTAAKNYVDLAQGVTSGRKAYFPVLVTAN